MIPSLPLIPITWRIGILAALIVAVMGFAWAVYDAIGDRREKLVIEAIEKDNANAVREADKARQDRERAIARDPAGGLRDQWTRD